MWKHVFAGLVFFSFLFAAISLTTAQSTLPDGAVNVYGSSSPTDTDISKTYTIQLFTGSSLKTRSYVSFQYKDTDGRWKNIDVLRLIGQLNTKYGRTNIRILEFKPIDLDMRTGHRYDFRAIVYQGNSRELYGGGTITFTQSSTSQKEPEPVVTIKPVVVIPEPIGTKKDTKITIPTGVVSIYGSSNVYDTKIDKIYTIQLFTSSPLAENVFIQFQWKNENGNWKKIVGQSMPRFSKRYGRSNILTYDFKPNEAGIFRSNYPFKFRAYVYAGGLTPTYYTGNSFTFKPATSPEVQRVETKQPETVRTKPTVAVKSRETSEYIIYDENFKLGENFNIIIPGTVKKSIQTFLGGKRKLHRVHDEIRLGAIDSRNTFRTIKVQNSITSENPKFGNDVFLEAIRKSVGYRYVFDGNMEVGERFVDVTEKNPVVMDFMGNRLIITGATRSSITVEVGERFFLKAGESSTTSDGKKIVLEKVVSNNEVEVSVSGTSDVAKENDVKHIGRTEIKVTDIVDYEGIEFDTAIVIVGTAATKSKASDVFNDGDGYIIPCGTLWYSEDCSADSPDWMWEIRNLDKGKPIIGVILDEDIDAPNDKPPKVGGKNTLDLGNHMFISLGKISKDKTSVTIKIRKSSARTIKVKTSSKEGFDITVGTNKESYANEEIITISGVLKWNSLPLRTANVNIKIIRPDGSVLANIPRKTDSSGSFVYKGMVPTTLSAREIGEWRVITEYSDSYNSLSMKASAEKKIKISDQGREDIGSEMIEISTDKESYEIGDVLVATVFINSDSGPVPDALVESQIILPSGKLYYKTSYRTDSSGSFIIKGTIPDVEEGSDGKWKLILTSSGKTAEKEVLVGTGVSKSGEPALINIDTGENEYKIGEEATFSGKLTRISDSSGISNVSIVLEFITPNGVSLTADRFKWDTDASGDFLYKGTIPDLLGGASVGEWAVIAKYPNGEARAETGLLVSA